MIGLGLGMLALVGLGAAGTSSGHREGDRVLRDLMDIASFALVFALITGVLIVTWEFRHGTIEQTFIISPRRERVMTAKALAAALSGGVLGLLGLAVAIVVAYIWIGGEPGIDFGSSELWSRAVRVLVLAVLWGSIGVGVGSLIRNQAGAIVAVFVWLFFLEPISSLISDTAADYEPGRLRMAFLEVGDDTVDVAVATAGFVTALYAVALVAAGTAVTLRRDIT
jgi:ABC-type transport system involved in multi-copper enzyme maturation permease subunit